MAPKTENRAGERRRGDWDVWPALLIWADGRGWQSGGGGVGGWLQDLVWAGEWAQLAETHALSRLDRSLLAGGNRQRAAGGGQEGKARWAVACLIHPFVYDLRICSPWPLVCLRVPRLHVTPPFQSLTCLASARLPYNLLPPRSSSTHSPQPLLASPSLNAHPRSIHSSTAPAPCLASGKPIPSTDRPRPGCRPHTPTSTPIPPPIDITISTRPRPTTSRTPSRA